MHYSQLLLTTLPLAGLSLALPSKNPLQARYGPQTAVGIPTQGLNCHTDYEPLHVLTKDMIQGTMINGAQILQKSHGTNKYDNGTIVYFPSEFNQQTFMSTTWPSFTPAEGCNLNAKSVYYMPLWYPGTTNIPLTGNQASPAIKADAAGDLYTTDIVVFTPVYQGGLVTGTWQFCGVLTNSDVSQAGSQALFQDTDPTTDGSFLNLTPSGYRQCNVNA